MSIRIMWEPRDLWLGLYWTHAEDGLRLYFCALPMLPILVIIKRQADA